MGAESFAQLRSDASPERLVYQMGLPDGAELVANPQGGLNVRRDGEILGQITKPLAWDADDEPVSVTMTLEDGDRLVLDVAHVGTDVRYPIMVDPNYAIGFGFHWRRCVDEKETCLNGYRTDGWGFVTSHPDRFKQLFGDSYLGRGLYSFNNVPSTYPAGSHGYWRFVAPGTTSLIAAEWTHIAHDGQAGGCIDYGILRDGGAAWVTHGLECGSFPQSYRYTCWDCSNNDGFSYDPRIDTIQFGEGFYNAGSGVFASFLGESTIYLSDADDPVISVTEKPSTAWMTGATNPSITATATDAGVGVDHLRFEGPAGWTGARRFANTNCLDFGYCKGPVSGSTRIENLAEGIQKIAVRAADRATTERAHEASTDVEVRLDRTPPTIAGSGDLTSASTVFYAQRDGGDRLGITVSARDGVVGGTDTQRRSGVASLEIWFDGALVETKTSPSTCLDTCAVAISGLELDQDEITPGPHSVRAVARDRLGHVASQTWNFAILGVTDYQRDLDNWKKEVERRAAPLTSSTRPLPVPPAHWRTPAACTSSIEAIEACEREVKDWGVNVRAWLIGHGALATQLVSDLPDLPLYRWADTFYAERFVELLSDEYDYARRTSVEDLSQEATVAMSFVRPIDLATFQRLGIGPIQSGVAFRGVLSAGDRPIVGGENFPDGGEVDSLAAVFYENQRIDVSEQLAELGGSRTDPLSDDDDRIAIDDALVQLRSAEATLAARGPFISGVAIKLPLTALAALRSNPLVDVARIEMLPVFAEARDALDGHASASEVRGFMDPEGSVASRAAGEGAFPTCDTRDEDVRLAPLRRNTTAPGVFMPSRHEYNVGTVGDVNPETGTRAKRHRLWFRWKADRSLQWYCLNRLGERGYEEDSRVLREGGPRWSTNWHVKYAYRSNIPNPHFDDLGCGVNCVNPYETQQWPDFSLTTRQGRAFRYRLLYYARFRSNSGETDDGSRVSIHTGSAVELARAGAERVYCNGNRAAQLRRSLVSSCLFLRNVACVGSDPLADGPESVRNDYSRGEPCTFG